MIRPPHLTEVTLRQLGTHYNKNRYKQHQQHDLEIYTLYKLQLVPMSDLSPSPATGRSILKSQTASRSRVRKVMTVSELQHLNSH